MQTKEQIFTNPNHSADLIAYEIHLSFVNFPFQFFTANGFSDHQISSLVNTTKQILHLRDQLNFLLSDQNQGPHQIDRNKSF